MAGRKGSPTGRCRGCNHSERVRIERLLAVGASIKGAARKFAIDYHALHRHWRNHVSAEARATYVAGAGATKDQLEEIVADESLGLIDHYRIVRAALYQGFSAAAELADSHSLTLLAGRLHENFRDCGRHDVISSWLSSHLCQRPAELPAGEDEYSKIWCGAE